MARTITEIQEEIILNIQGDERLSGLTSTSKVSIWRLFSYIVAVAIWTLEKVFDLHAKEVDNRILELKPHTARWYRSKALAFQYGFNLLPDSDQFDSEGFTEEQVEDSQIIKYAAVTESDDESRLVIKIATESSTGSDTGSQLSPISAAESDAFTAYIQKIKDAGVRTTIINFLPDRLYLDMDIYYDPLVLDQEGNNILTGGKTVEAAIQEYMKLLPFNGELVIAHLVDHLQAVAGVNIPHVNLIQTSWIDGALGDYGEIEPISVKKIPVSGYFEVVDFEGINYVANV